MATEISPYFKYIHCVAIAISMIITIVTTTIAAVIATVATQD